jgi:hypothetical protein
MQYNKWNNNIEKICECKPFYYCKNVWGINEQFLERSEKTTYQKRSNPFDNAIVNVFATKCPFQKNHMQKNKLKNWGYGHVDC